MAKSTLRVRVQSPAGWGTGGNDRVHPSCRSCVPLAYTSAREYFAVSDKSQDIGAVSPRQRMHQLARRAGVSTLIFAWISTAIPYAVRFDGGVIGMFVAALVTSINGVGWGLLLWFIFFAVSLARPSSGIVPGYTLRGALRLYAVMVVAGIVLGSAVAIDERGKAEANPSSTSAVHAVADSNSALVNCRRFYSQGAYEKAIDQCNAATLAATQDLGRFSQVMKSESLSKADLQFALEFCQKMLTITDTIALSETKLNQRESGRQAALKAVGWTVFIQGFLDLQDPKLTKTSSKSTLSMCERLRKELEAIYPGVTAEETKAIRERSGAH